MRKGLYLLHAPQRRGARTGGVVERSERMDVLIPFIGIACICLLVYYIYILMRSDS